MVETGRRRRTRQIGLAVETAVVGATATAVGAGTIIVVGNGLHLAGWALVPRATSHAAKYARAARQHARRWMGQITFGDVRPPSDPIRWNLPKLYSKQRGMDGICAKVPLPPLYVGPVWDWRFNPRVYVDHRFPQAKGGTDVFSNLQAVPGKFNQQKGVLTGYELRYAKRRFDLALGDVPHRLVLGREFLEEFVMIYDAFAGRSPSRAR